MSTVQVKTLKVGSIFRLPVTNLSDTYLSWVSITKIDKIPLLPKPPVPDSKEPLEYLKLHTELYNYSPQIKPDYVYVITYTIKSRKSLFNSMMKGTEGKISYLGEDKVNIPEKPNKFVRIFKAIFS